MQHLISRGRRAAAMVVAAVVMAMFGVMAPSSPAQASISPTAYPDSAAYSYNSSTGATTTDGGVSLTSWMQQIPGDRHLSVLSVPGTHDSGAYSSTIAGTIAQTQSMNFGAQLNAGIRAFDVRAGESGTPVWCANDVYIYHGGICMRVTLSSVLLKMTGFLQDHPSETILMRLGSSGSPTESTYNGDVCSLVKAVKDHVYDGTSTNPTLSDMRGKIVLFTTGGLSAGGDMKGGGSCSFSSFSHPISYSSLNAQDDYDQSLTGIVSDKWKKIQAQFDAANNGHPDTTYINYLSAANGALPCTFASGKSSCGTHDPQLLTGLTYGYFAGGYAGTCSNANGCRQIVEDQGLYRIVSCGVRVAGPTQICSVAYEGENMMAEAYIAGSDFSGPDSDDLSDSHVRPGFPGIPARTGIVMADFPGRNLISSIIDVNYLPWPTITAKATTVPNENGWYDHPVTIHFTCSDVMPGTCPADQTITGDGSGLTSTAETVTDITGVKSATSNVVKVNIDKVSPVITTPDPISVDATMPTGAEVPFTATFTDATSGVEESGCRPSSGSVFAIGTTTVTCTAKDYADNSAAKQFTVHVKSPAEMVGDLSTAVQGEGPGKSLSQKVAQIQKSIDAKDNALSCKRLGAFLHEVKAQSGKSLSSDLAASLTLRANHIEGTLACPTK